MPIVRRTHRVRHRAVGLWALAAGISMLVAAVPAGAHEYWLAPSRYRAAAGERVSLTAFVGTGFRGEPVPYPSPRVVRFMLSAARTLDLAPLALNGDIPWAAFTMPDAEGAVVAYQSNFADIELPAAEFDAYLELEGLSGPRATRARLGRRAGPGRERYARCPTVWIEGTAAAGRAPRVMNPAGLPLEIVPLRDPAGAAELPVRVLWRGRPLAGALVRAWNTALGSGSSPRDAAARDSVGPAAAARTDARGEARIAIGRPGEWLISTVHMVPCADRREADWESWWASLTLARGVSRP